MIYNIPLSLIVQVIVPRPSCSCCPPCYPSSLSSLSSLLSSPLVLILVLLILVVFTIILVALVLIPSRCLLSLIVHVLVPRPTGKMYQFIKLIK